MSTSFSVTSRPIRFSRSTTGRLLREVVFVTSRKGSSRLRSRPSNSEAPAICSSPTEARAISVFFPPNEEILAYARERAKKPFTPIYSDADAVFEREFDLDLEAIEPQVVRMGGVENGVDVAEVAGTPAPAHDVIATVPTSGTNSAKPAPGTPP